MYVCIYMEIEKEKMRETERACDMYIYLCISRERHKLRDMPFKQSASPNLAPWGATSSGKRVINSSDIRGYVYIHIYV